MDLPVIFTYYCIFQISVVETLHLCLYMCYPCLSHEKNLQ
jgi:hypothetical protein